MGSQSRTWLSDWTELNCSLPGSSVHGILQARILEWVVIFFSRGSSQPRDQIQVSCIAGRFFTIWAPREAHFINWSKFGGAQILDGSQPDLNQLKATLVDRRVLVLRCTVPQGWRWLLFFLVPDLVYSFCPPFLSMHLLLAALHLLLMCCFFTKFGAEA